MYQHHVKNVSLQRRERVRQKLDSRLTPSHFDVSKYIVSLPVLIFTLKTRTGLVLMQKP